jgi:hypothetical protein
MFNLYFIRQGATAVEDSSKPAAPSYFSGTGNWVLKVCTAVLTGNVGFKLGDNVTQSSVIKPAAKPAAARQVLFFPFLLFLSVFYLFVHSHSSFPFSILDS